MGHEDAGHYAAKHSKDRVPISAVKEAVERLAEGERISCAVAFEIAEEHGVSAEEVGFTLDNCEVRIVQCQLGLFGYEGNGRLVKPAPEVPEKIKQQIEILCENNRLSCKESWNLAAEFSISKREIADICEALKVKINRCQLGSF